jgi:hypothetical protein
MRGMRLIVASVMLVRLLGLAPVAAAAGGPAPGENCVPGTVWEDLASGVKYICIYDELYGGTRWELLASSQRGARSWLYRSSTQGCLFGTVGLSALSGGGADTIARTYRWPCSTAADRISQPAGELRTRIVVQRYGGGSWSTCRDSGYHYSTQPSGGWLAGLDMGSAADCGSGTYRALGFGAFYQGFLWRGGSLFSPWAWLP